MTLGNDGVLALLYVSEVWNFSVSIECDVNFFLCVCVCEIRVWVGQVKVLWNACAHTYLIFSHTTRIPQHFYLTHSHSILTKKKITSHSMLTLKFHTTLTYKKAKTPSFPKVSSDPLSLSEECVYAETSEKFYLSSVIVTHLCL